MIWCTHIPHAGRGGGGEGGGVFWGADKLSGHGFTLLDTAEASARQGQSQAPGWDVSRAEPSALQHHCSALPCHRLLRCAAPRNGKRAAICHSALSLGQGSPPDRRRVWINSRWRMVILNYRGLYNFKYYQPHLASENSHLVLNEAVIRTAWLNRWCPI